MVTEPKLLLWLMFIVWEIQVRSEISEKDCYQLRFVGLPDAAMDHVITVDDGEDLIVTFFLKTDGCQENISQLLISVTRNDETFPQPVCNILMGGKTCNASSSSQCTCSNQTFAQYRKRATLSDEGRYVWSLNDQWLKQHQKLNFTFRIIPAQGKEALAALLSVLVICVLAASAALACWMVRRRRQRVVVLGEPEIRDEEPSSGPRREESWVRGHGSVKETEENSSIYEDIDKVDNAAIYSVVEKSRDKEITYLHPDRERRVDMQRDVNRFESRKNERS